MSIASVGLGDDVEEAGAGVKTGEGCVLPAVFQLKTKRGVELDGARHIVGCQGDRADALNHRGGVIPICRATENRP